MLRSIEAERARLGLTKEELAKDLGISDRTYYNWVNELTDVPSTMLLKMSRKFNVGIDYLMQGCTGVRAESDKALTEAATA